MPFRGRRSSRTLAGEGPANKRKAGAKHIVRSFLRDGRVGQARAWVCACVRAGGTSNAVVRQVFASIGGFSDTLGSALSLTGAAAPEGACAGMAVPSGGVDAPDPPSRWAERTLGSSETILGCAGRLERWGPGPTRAASVKRDVFKIARGLGLALVPLGTAPAKVAVCRDLSRDPYFARRLRRSNSADLERF